MNKAARKSQKRNLKRINLNQRLQKIFKIHNIKGGRDLTSLFFFAVMESVKSDNETGQVSMFVSSHHSSLLPQNHYSIGNSKLSLIPPLDKFKNLSFSLSHFFFPFSLGAFRLLVMFIKRHKGRRGNREREDIIRAFASSFLILSPCSTIASSSSPKSKVDPC